MNQARARGGIAIVRPEWLHRVVTTWTHAPEEDFLLDLGDREDFMRRREAASSSNGAKDANGSYEASGSGGGGDEGEGGNDLGESEAGGSKTASVAGLEVDEEAREKLDDILHGFDYQAELDALMDSDTETDDGNVSGVRFVFSLYFFVEFGLMRAFVVVPGRLDTAHPLLLPLCRQLKLQLNPNL